MKYLMVAVYASLCLVSCSQSQKPVPAAFSSPTPAQIVAPIDLPTPLPTDPPTPTPHTISTDPPTPTPQQHTISGSLTISTVFVQVFGSECHPDPQIKPGTQIIVRNGSGSVVGVGSLGSSRWVANGSYYDCVFPLSVSVEDSDYYLIEVGSGRGSVAYSRSDLEQKGWRILLTL